eukprot:TRINITY_DN59489_c0_g1_i1.p1 TRINITY_DN59489_c0_g1~~TRINITY_DN59489_c0_g1_i1.p1  ORF type:complete len:231 (-),score=40.51 TRINITY_DN59489_c0_g1_i1:279-902(-)
MLTNRGSGLYVAPEILLGKNWNERVDVWACGLCCYFMSQASLPFDVNHSAVKERLMVGKRVALEWKHPLSDLAQVFIVQCLTVDPTLRPPMLELAQHKIFAEGARHLKRRDSEKYLARKTVASFDVLDWQERRHGCDLLQRLADYSCAREQERRSSSGLSADSNSCLSEATRIFSDGIDVSTVPGQKFKRRAKFFTTYGGEHDLISH